VKLNLEQYIVDEFPSPEYDRGFINDVVDNYTGEINYKGDLHLDNTDLLYYIFDCLNAIEHVSLSTANDFDLDEYCKNNPDFNDAMNGVN
jgi:hypothetical protein